MTATPIPRTLALFLYGDMDISIINELPPGRQVVTTTFVNGIKRDKVYTSLKNEIEKGRQAYVVCPLVEESESLQAESAVETEKLLKEKYFRNYNVALLHGKMTAKEKDEIMHQFKQGIINVLVSTTVIEVGVNVPNATVMIVENSERFGLAQLHQLRGRVGRGMHKSYCVLISESKTQEAIERMKIMTSTNDGFVIAEKDLEMRGTGEFFGTRQHGLPELKMADIVKDIDILKETRDIAREMIDNEYLKMDEYKNLRDTVNKFLNEKIENTTFN
jgi:ATP-dependent DNA helicase RecG